MSKSMVKTLILSLALSSTLVMASNDKDLPLNADVKARISATLEEQGYSVGKIKIEDGLYEAYAKKDGMRYEVFLDTEMKVVRVKED
jgi:hypothetical protein